MGRKSSAKAHTRDSSTPPQGSPPESRRSLTPTLVMVIVALVAVVGVFAFMKNGRDADVATAEHAAHDQPAAAQATDEAKWAKVGPHKQASYPPLPTQSFPPPRSHDVVRAAYMFAAEHPEILSYVPCFCGCERAGHKGNEDCFVAARDEKGDVTAWEAHGYDCTVCIDVATEARQMFTSGASARDIRAAVERKWAGFNGGHTPTPHPPSKSE